MNFREEPGNDPTEGSNGNGGSEPIESNGSGSDPIEGNGNGIDSGFGTDAYDDAKFPDDEKAMKALGKQQAAEVLRHFMNARRKLKGYDQGHPDVDRFLSWTERQMYSGNRNNALYEASMRALNSGCEFLLDDLRLLASKAGLEDAEIERTIESAMKAADPVKNPEVLWQEREEIGIDEEAIFAMVAEDQPEAGPEQTAGPADPAELFERAVALAMEKLRVQDEAKQRFLEQQLGGGNLPERIGWRELEAAPDPKWSIEGVMPEEGNIALLAAAKAGKSTTIAEIVHCNRTGDKFLGRFEVFSVGSRIAILDLELGLSQLKRYYLDALKGDDQVSVWPLKGNLQGLDVLSPRGISRLAELLRGTDLLIVDPLGPLLAQLGIEESDNTGVRRVLNGLDRLKAEAGIKRMIVVHHFGHNGERARGASVFADWRDMQWRIVLDKPADPANSERFFSADGRDGEPIQEQRLMLGHDRRPFLVPGSRAEKKQQKEQTDYRGRVLQGVDDNTEALTRNKLALFVGGNKQKVLNTIRELVDEGTLEEVVPPGGKVLCIQRA